MNMLERAIVAVAPQWAERRARSRAITAHYDGATIGRRASSLKADASDADGAARNRMRMAWYGRDMVRNTPYAARAQSVIAGGIVGDGIIPKVAVSYPGLNDDAKKRIRERGLRRIEEHLDSTAIDRDGRCNLYGLQRLAANAVVDAGECLIRIHDDNLDPAALPLQLEVLEADYLDSQKFGWVSGEGGEIREGIEYNATGQRVAYWVFPDHPGANWSMRPGTGVSVRVPADEILHIYRMDRPGQNRGVTWFAPVMMKLQDMADYEDAQLTRQKIAACFTAFRSGGADQAATEGLEELAPGLIYELGENEQITMATPPTVDGGDEFSRSVLRSVASGLGITYEALTGDLSKVNFSSGRMGRLEMDQNISVWQWLMLIPQMMQPLGRRFVDAWQVVDGQEMVEAGLPHDIWSHICLTWVPPRKIIVDPAREFEALKGAVRSGFASRQQVIRQLGVDPERLLEEIAQDKAEADRLGLLFDSDPRADAGRAPRGNEKPNDEPEGESA